MLNKNLRKSLAITLGLTTIATVLQTVTISKVAYADSSAPELTQKLMTYTNIDSGVSLTWQKAKDDKTPQNKLRYYLYQEENNYDTDISGWESNAKLLNKGGSIDISQWNVTGLKEGSTYFYMLLVEDEDGNKTAYEIECVKIKSAGNNAAIKTTNNNVVIKTTSNETANLNSSAPRLGAHRSLNDIGEKRFVWQKATDDKTPQNKLRYYLYEAENNNYGTNISDWEKNAKLLNEGGTLDLGEWNLTGLIKDDSAYAFMLVVEDEDGNKTPYERALIDIKFATHDIGDKEKFAKAKEKALKFMSTYNFTSNMSWSQFSSSLQKEVADCGIISVGDCGKIDPTTGVVTATIFLNMNYGERYIFPYTGQASDIGNGAKSNSIWNQNADGTWKLFVNGQAATGWQQVGNKWYYFNQNGIMQTGWVKDNGKWYCLYSDGSMAVNTTIYGYTLGANGEWIS